MRIAASKRSNGGTGSSLKPAEAAEGANRDLQARGEPEEAGRQARWAHGPAAKRTPPAETTFDGPPSTSPTRNPRATNRHATAPPGRAEPAQSPPRDPHADLGWRAPSQRPDGLPDPPARRTPEDMPPPARVFFVLPGAVFLLFRRGVRGRPHPRRVAGTASDRELPSPARPEGRTGRDTVLGTQPARARQRPHRGRTRQRRGSRRLQPASHQQTARRRAGRRPHAQPGQASAGLLRIARFRSLVWSPSSYVSCDSVTVICHRPAIPRAPPGHGRHPVQDTVRTGTHTLRSIPWAGWSAAATLSDMKSEISTQRFTQLLSAASRGARLARLLAVQQLSEWGWPPSRTVSESATHRRVGGERGVARTRKGTSIPTRARCRGLGHAPYRSYRSARRPSPHGSAYGQSHRRDRSRSAHRRRTDCPVGH